MENKDRLRYESDFITEHKHSIDVSKLTKQLIGQQTVAKIDKELKKLYEKNIINVEVDLRGFSIHKDSIMALAKLKYLYECEFITEDKDDYIDSLISTGIFLKEDLGVENFVKYFKYIVEVSDYPLMIKDNRLVSDGLVAMNVIKPIGFSEHKFFYNIIKPHLLEPVLLEKSILEGKEIFVQESVHLSDIGDKEFGFRFATNKNERTLLDIFTAILNNRLKGFSKY